MKKFLLLIVLIFTLTLISCTENKVENVLEDFAENNNSPYQLNTALSEEELEHFLVIGGFGGNTIIDSTYNTANEDFYSFIDENPVTYYQLSGYPNCLNPYVITGIYTTDPSIEIYDYSVGDSFDHAEITSFFTSIGYSESESIFGTYINQTINIHFITNLDNDIIKIIVLLSSTCSVVF